nr:MAG TPA: hypothetical protein [Caudoviricetes sp.]
MFLLPYFVYKELHFLYLYLQHYSYKHILNRIDYQLPQKRYLFHWK